MSLFTLARYFVRDGLSEVVFRMDYRMKMEEQFKSVDWWTKITVNGNFEDAFPGLQNSHSIQFKSYLYSAGALYTSHTSVFTKRIPPKHKTLLLHFCLNDTHTLAQNAQRTNHSTHRFDNTLTQSFPAVPQHSFYLTLLLPRVHICPHHLIFLHLAASLLDFHFKVPSFPFFCNTWSFCLPFRVARDIFAHV